MKRFCAEEIQEKTRVEKKLFNYNQVKEKYITGQDLIDFYNGAIIDRTIYKPCDPCFSDHCNLICGSFHPNDSKIYGAGWCWCK